MQSVMYNIFWLTWKFWLTRWLSEEKGVFHMVVAEKNDGSYDDSLHRLHDDG